MPDPIDLMTAALRRRGMDSRVIDAAAREVRRALAEITPAPKLRRRRSSWLSARDLDQRAEELKKAPIGAGF